MLNRLRDDVRFAFRSYARAPWFHAVAIITLGLGMGAAVAIFSVVSGLLLKPLGYAAPEQLVDIQGESAAVTALSYPDYDDVRHGSHTLSKVAVWQGWRAVMRDRDGTLTRRPAASVSANFFDVLGVRPQLGRFFTPDEDVAGHAPTVVLADELWRTEFGASPDVLDKSIEVEGTQYRVIGVAAKEFADPLNASLGRQAPTLIWRSHPDEFERGARERGWVGFWVIARMRPRATTADVQRDVSEIIRAGYPTGQAPGVQVRGTREALVSAVRPTLQALLIAVFAMLLIGCANVANLLLSRGSVRRREIAIRTSLGATRARIVAQLLTESLVLSLASGVLGLLIGITGIPVLMRLAGHQLPRSADVIFDWRVASFTAATSLLTAALFGLLPALNITSDIAGTLRETGRGAGAGRQSQRIRHVLVVAETALALTLLVGASLLIRTFWNLQHVRPGFDAESVTAMRLDLAPRATTTADTRDDELRRVEERVGLLHGVSSVGSITDMPMSGAVNSTGVARSDQPNEPDLTALVRAATPDYFRTMHVAVRRGRAFTASDVAGGLDVAMINEALAHKLFPGEDPIGRVVVVREVPRQIVGVSANVKEFTLRAEGDLALYTPYAQERQHWMRESVWLLVRTTDASQSTVASIRSAIAAADPTISISAPRPVREFVEADLAAPRFRATLVLLFAGIALALAAIGTAGVIAYDVSQRISEIGIRMALGATSTSIQHLILGQSVRLALGGVAVGLLFSAIAARMLGHFLFGVGAADPLTFVVTASLLLGMVLVGSFVPARRASRVDPATILRS